MKFTRLRGRVAGLGDGTHSIFLGQVADDTGNSGIRVSRDIDVLYGPPNDRNYGSAGLLHCNSGQWRRRCECSLVVRTLY